MARISIHATRIVAGSASADPGHVHTAVSSTVASWLVFTRYRSSSVPGTQLTPACRLAVPGACKRLAYIFPGFVFPGQRWWFGKGRCVNDLARNGRSVQSHASIADGGRRNSRVGPRIGTRASMAKMRRSYQAQTFPSLVRLGSFRMTPETADLPGAARARKSGCGTLTAATAPPAGS
jgi:hypothetical protein